MSEPRAFPYGGVPVYNPLSLSKDEALAQFYARQAAYESLMNLLRQERPSHVLIIGTRGMGKTTLLQRVNYGVEDDPELNSRYLVLAFPEEQYNVNRLHRFLLNTVDALADAMERLRNERMLKRVEEFAETVGKLGQEEIEERVPKFLAEVGREMQKSLLLLVDNADRLFETIDNQEQWRLRELLSNRRDLTFFGATTQASDGIYGPKRAFFEFFQILNLTPLTLEEVRTLLLRLSESVEEREGEKGSAKRRVQEWLDADAARLRTLVQLTGGNPRTTVLLFHLVLDGLDGGAREYLEQLLDQCTPGYKGRVDELPPQAQQVLDAVALKWDPVTAMEVAEYTSLETSTVSTQLTRLTRQGVLEKADAGDSKKALYQVAERFFNIWYLMRASRRVRAKLRWFVEFLRVFFEPGELEKMALERLRRLEGIGLARSAKMETAFAYALASGVGRYRFEDHLRQKCAGLEPDWQPYLELLPETSSEEGAQDEAALREAIKLDPKSARSWDDLGDVLAKVPERKVEAEAAYRKAIELDPRSAEFWSDLGCLLGKIPGRRSEAEAAYRKAIELDPKQAWAGSNLGRLLAEVPERRDEAEAAYRMAIELDPRRAWTWNNLGDLLAMIPERREEAEAAYREATKVDPEHAWAWNNLGNLLAILPERWDDAEAAYRKATELDPMHAWAWDSLGDLLAKIPERRDEAEVSLRKSTELEPDEFLHVRSLGVLLYCGMLREQEALPYIRLAHQLEPEDPVSAAILAACVRASDAEVELVAVFLDASGQGGFWNGLLELCQNYPPFGKILLGICDLVQEHDPSNRFVPLHRAVALAQLGDFPRASVALEDALLGDPIDLLSTGRMALEVFFAAAMRNGRVRDCLELLDKKEWKDAWRPIYEALRSVEEGSGEYLKRVAVEIREPALQILRRIAPELPNLPARTR